MTVNILTLRPAAIDILLAAAHFCVRMARAASGCACRRSEGLVGTQPGGDHRWYLGVIDSHLLRLP